MSIEILWHGHATFSLNLDGTRVVVDPFLKGKSPVAQTAPEEVDADYLWITHGHGDHIYDAIDIATRTNAKIISNFEIIEWFLNTHKYENCHPLHIGGGFNFDFGYLKMTPAFHGSMLPDGANGGMPGGFLLKGEKNVYIAGDTALFSDMALIGAHDIDVAILPIGDNFTMGPDDSILAIHYLKPKKVIPCHFNTFGYIMQDVDAWAKRVETDTDAEPVVLEVDGSLKI